MPDPICPFARQDILHGGNHDQRPTIIPIGTALHIAVTTASGNSLGRYFDGVTDDSTFYVDVDGVIWQFNPVDRKANAQYAGNAFRMGSRLCGMVSIETEGISGPLNDAQVAALERLYAWLNAEWSISLDVSTEWNGAGAGWHSKYREWNTDAHNCPGPDRVDQLVNIILPAARRAVASTPQEETLMLATVHATPQGVTVPIGGIAGNTPVAAGDRRSVTATVNAGQRVWQEAGQDGLLYVFSDPAGDTDVAHA